MTLTDLQKRRIIEGEPRTGAQKIADYIARFDNLSLDDFPAMEPTKREEINKIIGSKPNTVEQSEWKGITLRLNTLNPDDRPAVAALLAALTAYVDHWSTSLPEGNHVEEAKSQRAALQRMMDGWEEDDFRRLDPMSIDSLEDFLKKYPATTHRGDVEESIWALTDRTSIDAVMSFVYKHPRSIHAAETDDLVWDLTDKGSIDALQQYINLFPSGKHLGEAKGLITAILDWQDVKAAGDIFATSRFLHDNPDSPLAYEARVQLASQKEAEIRDMRANASSYSAARLLQLLDEGVFHENELFRAGVLTPRVLDSLRNASLITLPEMAKVIAQSSPSCDDDATDVYFWGIPSTGKSCLLMGLSSSDSLNVNLATGSGNYAEALMQFVDCGKTIPATPGSFVATLNATITGDDGIDHKVNLVEMAGEDFAFKIVKNPDGNFAFEDMGTGATQLLMNDNRKVFFIIIDPTVSRLNYPHYYVKSYDEQTGDPIYDIEMLLVDQLLVVKKLVDLFAKPENAKILKKVDAINFVMTKSDLLDSNESVRDEKAYQIFNAKYRSKVLKGLKNLCEEYAINEGNDHNPKLYTFSLGRFYVGGIYDYDNTDSEKIIEAIRLSTFGTRRMSFWDKLKKKVNG